jgi:hypothetical protein
VKKGHKNKEDNDNVKNAYFERFQKDGTRKSGEDYEDEEEEEEEEEEESD